MHINWGIIGCGDVTEVKSGPAFQKVAGSSLVAVMRRDAGKAEDYARRHHVDRWYSDADLLINDPAVNAIYVATPPSTHAQYTLAAIAAGKPVYVEKPMALHAGEARQLRDAAASRNIPLCVAHYRREQPLFRQVKALLENSVIGAIRTIELSFFRPLLTADEQAQPKTAWRVDPAISGGGLFHDLAPHQLDILVHLLGRPVSCQGMAVNQGGAYGADDAVTAQLQFPGNILFTGNWNFTVADNQAHDQCDIIGDRGAIRFSFFDTAPLVIHTSEGVETISFPPLQHVQQPMIEAVVRHFSGHAPNPCSGDEGVTVMELIDAITSSSR